MHHALRLEEILLNIFGQCYSPSPQDTQRPSLDNIDLAALARTCWTFKEPALNALWTELDNLSPLARCLPNASHRIYPGYTWYSFSRPLKPAEWDVLRSYTRRVRSVQDFTRGLNWESVKMIFNPPTTDPLFPNLRNLRWEFIRESFPLMHHLAVPSLTSLDINFVFGDVPPFHSFPHSLGNLCPSIRRFRIRMRRPQVGSDEAISSLVLRWTSLQVLYCPYISLDVNSISHLSRTPSLTHLSFSLNPVVADHIIYSRTILVFSKLCDLEISCQSLGCISNLLRFIRLPSLEFLTVNIESCPSKYAFKSFLTVLQKMCTPNSLVSLRLIQTRSPTSTNHGSERYQLTLEDIRPCMSFDYLRRIDIDTAWTVNLTDFDLFDLASALPHLEHLLINKEWGWDTRGGVTPSGLVQLLERLPSLQRFCLAMDTRRYKEIPEVIASTRTASSSPRAPFSVNVADSWIEPEAVDALAVFFGAIMQPHTNVSSFYWNTTAMTYRLDSEISKRLWEDVFVKAYGRMRMHSPTDDVLDSP